MKAVLDQLRTDQGFYRELSKVEEFAYWDSLIAEARRYGKEVSDEVFRLRFEAGKAAAKDQV
jgi:hypothetical protein